MMRMLLALMLSAGCAECAVAQPVVCDLTAPDGVDAFVVQLDCEQIGERAAYTLDAHDEVHRQVAALDAMLDEAVAQRDHLRETLQAERVIEIITLEDLQAELDLAHDLLGQAADPPSRTTWAAIGAGGATVTALIIALWITESP